MRLSSSITLPETDVKGHAQRVSARHVFTKAWITLGSRKQTIWDTRDPRGYSPLFEPHTEIRDNVFARMMVYLRTHLSVAAIGGRLLNSDGTLQTSCVQKYPTILNQLADVEAIKVRFPAVRNVAD